MNKVPSILKRLFTSKVRVKLLGHFLTRSNDSFYLRQLEKLLNEAGSPIGRELQNLEKIGILKSRHAGNQKHYRVNKEMIIYEELRMIFLKTTIGQVIKNTSMVHLQKEKNIRRVILILWWLGMSVAERLIKQYPGAKRSFIAP